MRKLYYAFGLASAVVFALIQQASVPNWLDLLTSGCDCSCPLITRDNDATRSDDAFRHLERRRDRAIGEQTFSTAQC